MMMKPLLQTKLPKNTISAITPQGIYVYGAREHNLKSINVFIPHHKITVVTGLSGSGKSSLVFDTIYAEGQRRYIESLSSYTRFFIDQVKKPDLDSITGLCPSVAIDQYSLNLNPRSTIGTLTETYDYVRLLFARLGTPYCLKHDRLLSTCPPKCSVSFPSIQPKLFSFNSPIGACPKCKGLGYLMEDQLKDDSYTQDISDSNEIDIESTICPTCKGQRLNPFALKIKIKNKNISEFTAMSIEQMSYFCTQLDFKPPYKIIAEKILNKLQSDLQVLQTIGLGYLSLNRSIHTLSGGEAKRARLAGQISSPLIGVLYILDEPSIGLHARDQDRLLKMLVTLRKRGNTVLIVEHDEKTIRFADHIIDLGPLAGEKGGRVIAQGTLQDIVSEPKSFTGLYLSGKKNIQLDRKRNTGIGHTLEITGASGHNLKSIHAQFPLGCLIGITGVSGSGKSTLIVDTLYKALLRELNQSSLIQPEKYQAIKGLEQINKVIAVNQKPIGRTPRSVPATYIGVMSHIRSILSYLPAARMLGLNAGDFSFNINNGRCPTCAGTGQIKQQILFLLSTARICDTCQGRRYKDEILSIRYKGRNIHEILNMNISTARHFFVNHYPVKKQLDLMEQVGLGYLTLGQNSSTLSGGEAQRIKLTRELAKQNRGHTLYILDEPTTGLHFNDVEKLLFILKQLTLKNNTVIIIEHHIDVIKSCDWLIDLGPEGGPRGGQIVAQGTPEQIARSPHSKTAPFLRKIFN